MANKNNSGALFNNSAKRQGSNQPDMTGNVTIDGVDYNISAWKNTSRTSNTEYLSLSLTKRDVDTSRGPSRDAGRAYGSPGTSTPSGPPDMGDEPPPMGEEDYY